MKFTRGLLRVIATATTISLLLPIAVFAFASGPQTGESTTASAASAPVVSAPIADAALTLQTQDLFGKLNGEVGGIPQYGGWTPSSISNPLTGESQGMSTRIDAALAHRAPAVYAATPIAVETIGPDFAITDVAAADVLLKADGQASATYKLTATASLPSLIQTPMQMLASRSAAAGAVTIKDLVDGVTAAVAPAPASKTIVTGHSFGTVLTGVKPSVGTSPFSRELATMVFGSFTAELVLRLGNAPESPSTLPPAWLALWLEISFALAGFAALSNARGGFSARNALLVFIKREQRE